VELSDLRSRTLAQNNRDPQTLSLLKKWVEIGDDYDKKLNRLRDIFLSKCASWTRKIRNARIWRPPWPPVWSADQPSPPSADSFGTKATPNRRP
jgi:hypothetical protein